MIGSFSAQDAVTHGNEPYRPIMGDLPLDFILQVEYEDVFTVYDFHEVFAGPPFMDGVPIEPLIEDGPYWRGTWDSLSNLESQKETIQTHKAELYRDLEQIQLIKSNNLFGSRTKTIDEAGWCGLLESRIRSEESKLEVIALIRDCAGRLGALDVHPNQLVAKRLMGVTGLCSFKTLQALYARLGDLLILKADGQLAMEPIDFLRWRLGETADRTRSHDLRFICQNLANSHQVLDGKTHGDWVMTEVRKRADQIRDNLKIHVAKHSLSDTDCLEPQG